MQIIIVQHEIESAVKAYVLSQLNVKEGQRIDVSFAATRGEDGLKATIDIVSDEQSPAASTGVTTVEEEQPAPASTAASPIRRARLTTPVRKEEPTKEPVEQKEVGTGEAADEGGEQQASAEQSEASEQEEEQPAPVTTGRSLFANLKKPANS